LGKSAFHTHFYKNNPILRNNRSKPNLFTKFAESPSCSGNRAHGSHSFAKKTLPLSENHTRDPHNFIKKAPKLLENMLYTHKFTQKTRTTQQLIQKVDLCRKNHFHKSTYYICTSRPYIFKN
jgi:hypothetical protein